MIQTRNAIRVLLLYEDKLLLMLIQDFDISALDGKKNKRFWCTIGGGIEHGESIQEAALREIHEETGIAPQEITLGPVVWVSEVDLILKGKLTRLNEHFIVAHTVQENVSLHMPTPDEKNCVKQLSWLTVEQIEKSDEVIFPIRLAELLPDIIAGDYPDKPIKIN